MAVNPHLSIVIPMYNEEKRIGGTLRRILEFMKEKNYTWEIVAMDDGSRDRSIAVAKEILAGAPHRVIPNEQNMGKGATIRRGMLEAKGDLRLFTDADLSTPIEELDKLKDAINRGHQVAIGSRALKESQLIQRQPWYREMMGRTFNLIVQILHLPGIKDTQCGFKLFTSEAAEAVFPRQSMTGFCFDVEILTIAKRLGYRIAEVPVRWIDSPQSKVSPIKDSMKMFWDLLRLKFKRH